MTSFDFSAPKSSQLVQPESQTWPLFFHFIMAIHLASSKVVSGTISIADGD